MSKFRVGDNVCIWNKDSNLHGSPGIVRQSTIPEHYTIELGKNTICHVSYDKLYPYDGSFNMIPPTKYGIDYYELGKEYLYSGYYQNHIRPKTVILRDKSDKGLGLVQTTGIIDIYTPIVVPLSDLQPLQKPKDEFGIGLVVKASSPVLEKHDYHLIKNVDIITGFVYNEGESLRDILDKIWKSPQVIKYLSSNDYSPRLAVVKKDYHWLVDTGLIAQKKV